MYVVDGTKPTWGPKDVCQELRDQIKSVQILKIRTDQLKSRTQGISDLVRDRLCFAHSIVEHF